MRAWAGRADNVAAAQAAFAQRLRMNALARDGRWTPQMEQAAAQ